MCSFVRARMALCASRSLARLRASWAVVRVETLRVPFESASARESQEEEGGWFCRLFMKFTFSLTAAAAAGAGATAALGWL